MKNLILASSFIILFMTEGNAQKAYAPNWDITVSYGSLLPIGSFKKIVPENSITYNKEGETFYINGSGAQVGQFVSFALKFNIKPSWSLSVDVYHSRNEVNIQPIFDYVNGQSTFKYSSAYHEDNKMIAALMGFSYKLILRNWSIDFGPQMGIATMAAANYVFESYAPLTFEQTDNNSSSPIFGIKSNLNYDLSKRFFVGATFALNKANFEYEIKRMQPGSTYATKNDRTTYEAWRLGVTVGLKL